ncbi:MFS transporter [Rhizohabitans arisaemae]|uniref:MFS transporter n=1 Tax=Rhizohabitans arisaemae TaxID=2720610 RepID=UPI0024B07BA7|nr:MFS transporter [Rhizohabitans arisaemae]
MSKAHAESPPADDSPAPVQGVSWMVTASLAVILVSIAAIEAMPAVALPLLQRELNTTPAGGSTLIVVSALMAAIISPLVGKLGDRYNGRDVTLVLLLVVVIGGVISTVAPTLAVLVVGQVFLGCGIGFMPLAFVLQRKLLPPAGMKVATGVVISTFTAGGTAGALLAGPIAEGLSWQWMFGLPTILMAAAGLVFMLVTPRAPLASPPVRGPFDWVGTVLFSAAMIVLLLFVSSVSEAGLLSVPSLAVLAVLAGIVALWIRAERRAAEPLVDLRMLRGHGIRGVAVVELAAAIAGAFGMFMLPQILAAPTSTGFGLGQSITVIGFALLPATIVALVVAPLGGLADARFGSRAVVLAATVAIALCLVPMLTLPSQVWHYVLFMTAYGAGQALTMTSLTNAVISVVGPNETGIATGLFMVIRAVGTSLGAPVVALVITGGPDGSGTAGSYVMGFALAIGAFVVTAALTSLIPGRRTPVAA